MTEEITATAKRICNARAHACTRLWTRLACCSTQCGHALGCSPHRVEMASLLIAPRESHGPKASLCVYGMASFDMAGPKLALLLYISLAL
eukprot:1572271-Pleurochrysis_carterae.AAC.6